MPRSFILLAAVFAFVGVALGAFGAHGLAATLTANGREGTFRTANLYHMIHALALLGIAWAVTQYPDSSLVMWAGYLFVAGILLFSGSLYILAIFDIGIMGAVAPLGGLALLGGWALLFAAAWRGAS
jgi:uncharacterized membrane protein YgdD (TMEM256/DUF423 family)